MKKIMNISLDELKEKLSCGGEFVNAFIDKNKLNYKPIVGDSFTGDTPLFIKYNENDMIDIMCISEMINENEVNKDEYGREYDYSDKEYKVLCRSGWMSPTYVYRHKTDKAIYEVSDSDKGMSIEVTEDHSLFNKERIKIKPSDIDSTTELEYYEDNENIFTSHNKIEVKEDTEAFDYKWLNGTIRCKLRWVSKYRDKKTTSKRELSFKQYILNCIMQQQKNKKIS